MTGSGRTERSVDVLIVGAGTETYVHDDNANVVRQTVKDVTTVYDNEAVG
ncbi:hypothetical protein ACYCCF_27735 [Streptomyces argenteolus]